MAYTDTHAARLKDVKRLADKIKEEMEPRTLTFTFPDMGITTPMTLDFQNCEFSFIEHNKFDVVILDAEDKFICGKLR